MSGEKPVFVLISSPHADAPSDTSSLLDYLPLIRP
jgi:hypothetical protein